MTSKIQRKRGPRRIIPPSPIRSKRLESGLTQTELAAAAGISQVRLSRLELRGESVDPAEIEGLLRMIERLSIASSEGRS